MKIHHRAFVRILRLKRKCVGVVKKIGIGNVANKKDGDDMKKDIEGVVHDENVDYEREMADREDEDDEDSPPGEVSLSRSQVEALSNGTSTDYDPFISEERVGRVAFRLRKEQRLPFKRFCLYIYDPSLQELFGH
ncbi:hypothetical protein RND71_004967 [Anisodus tanguticus]|uniref:Uncharacterized protein n=1 Tax=Anisodus tanguticus TaxID=243964 RepID=A0AAE1VV57_9SOLA|nr:hypothetical protein RND71_004967 [Anisodus tanguticus]